MTNAEFMKLVQDHEREWGTQTYSNRPDLVQIMRAVVVVFWRPVPKDKQQAKNVDTRMFITTHDNLQLVEKFLTQMLVRSGLDLPDRKIAYIFFKQEQHMIESVEITFAKVKPTQN
jgi:hypothetical protein